MPCRRFTALLALAVRVAFMGAPTPSALAADAPMAPPVRLLLLSGANNQSAQKTTPLLRKMYEASGRFRVEVCTNVPALKAGEFARHDVIVSDYPTSPDNPGRRWPADLERAFLDYLAAGHGFVIYHGAIAAWNDWPEFAELVGQSVQKSNGPGELHSFAVRITAPEHPVTKGMPDFQHVPDELRHRWLVRPTGRVLATALAVPSFGGAGQQEPVVVVTERGQGRTFCCNLGHPEAMHGPGFQALMLRGTEWAATGQVTIPIPTNWVAVGGPAAEKLKHANALGTPSATNAASKIKFRLEAIRPDGLRGPPDGLVSVAYEFCVPADPAVYQEVRRLDPSVQISPGSRGRIGCSKQQALCIGNTHQRNWREILLALAALPYVAEVRECFFE
ncbi:hypothetical protein LBMAG56_27760 [Verrucomicrobiota bacterium]|nr:hypothetical protein LBMAG56_27760 [Verrucomicrobiota bacterium]